MNYSIFFSFPMLALYRPFSTPLFLQPFVVIDIDVFPCLAAPKTKKKKKKTKNREGKEQKNFSAFRILS